MHRTIEYEQSNLWIIEHKLRNLFNATTNNDARPAARWVKPTRGHNLGKHMAKIRRRAQQNSIDLNSIFMDHVRVSPAVCIATVHKMQTINAWKMRQQQQHT